MVLNKLAKDYFNSVIKRYPELGTFLGLHKYDGQWSDESRERYLKDIKFFEEYLVKFKKIDPKFLTPKERLDRKIVLYDIKLTLFNLKELRFWELNPDVVEGMGSILFLLLAREEQSLEKRMRSIIKGLEGLPKALKEVKTRIKKPYKLWTEIALESCLGMEIFLKSLLKIKLKKSLKEKLKEKVKISLKAIKEYENFLRKEILSKAQNRYIIGREKFEKLIKLRELGFSLTEMLKIAKKTIIEARERLKEIAKEIDPKLTVKEVEEKIKDNYPKSFKQVFKKYKESVGRARKFIIENHLMEIPKNEKVIIKETPKFLVPTIPFAACFSPAKFTRKKISIYVITPSRLKKRLRKHNLAAIANTSVHEAYPGHHLQSVFAYKNPSLIRTLSHSLELVEGWAHYCEEYMKEIGYNNKKEIRFIQTLDEIWRAVRVIIDIKLHFGQMSFNQAVNLLMKEVGMEKESAIAEVKKHSQDPSYKISYLIGKYLIKKLKEKVKKKMKKRYSDKFFHQVILKAGSIPIKYLKEEFNLEIKKYARN